MIRDPSDGSVREENSDLSAPRHRPNPLKENADTIAKPLLGITTSGLPMASTKSKDVLRLEASREWLKEYHGSNS